IDITERKVLEELLIENEERWNSALEGSELGVWDWSGDTDDVFNSRQMKTMLGYSEDESLPNWESRVHPDDLEEAIEQLESHFRREIPLVVSEYRVRCKDGSYIWVLDRGKVIDWSEEGKHLRIIGTNLDITRKVEQEKKLRIREERWQFALEGSELGVWDWSQERNETFYSKQWKSMLGYEKHEIGNSPNEWDRRLHPDEVYVLKQSQAKQYAGETDLFTEEHRMLCKDGSYKWVLDKGKVIDRDEEGQPTRVVGMHLDITTRKELELEGKFLNILLRHDLLNRFVIIGGYLSIIDPSDLSEESQSYLKKASIAVNQSSELIEKIHKLRMLHDKIPLEIINLSDLCTEVIYNTKNLAEEKGITFERYPCTHLVKGSHLTKEMLTNLIENAINHSKGSIIRMSTFHNSDEVTIVIEDDGIGIDESLRDKIFERGYKGKHSEGSGIGLFLVKKIITSSGGRIEVKASELGGARFEVTFLKADL
ncbi:MAG: PAS domain-containing sensor histidine kinase, partial [Candidatus Heimdallarchaeota archaeon]|nr:PAS domain-containing sensor histidine kinase [Candidatus Heimdallarchaeota archaeon]MCK5049545.1 PAS domain-containing sensor histidine kinase [Candidatus Heimdallarchaeota archaeon]